MVPVAAGRSLEQVGLRRAADLGSQQGLTGSALEDRGHVAAVADEAPIAQSSRWARHGHPPIYLGTDVDDLIPVGPNQLEQAGVAGLRYGLAVIAAWHAE